MDDRTPGGREEPGDRTRRTGRLVRPILLTCAFAVRTPWLSAICPQSAEERNPRRSSSGRLGRARGGCRCPASPRPRRARDGLHHSSVDFAGRGSGARFPSSPQFAMSQDTVHRCPGTSLDGLAFHDGVLMSGTTFHRWPDVYRGGVAACEGAPLNDSPSVTEPPMTSKEQTSSTTRGCRAATTRS